MASKRKVVGVTYRVDLEPNKTFGVRSAEFEVFTRPGFLTCGVLTVFESAKKDTKQYVRRYAVQEYTITDPVSYGRGRRFQLSKPLPSREVHWAFISYHNNKTICTCDSHSARGYCVHVQALKAILNAGYIPAQAPRQRPRPYETNV